MREHQPHPGPSAPIWWAPVTAREQAEREANLQTEEGNARRIRRNDAVLALLRARKEK